MAQTVIGTPFNMSPELVNNEPYGAKSDVWALGCTLYELASLQHAFGRGENGKGAANMCSLVLGILRGRYPPLTGYSAGLIKLVDSMIQLDPSQRPTMRDILATPFVVTAAARAADGQDDAGMGLVAAARDAMLEENGVSDSYGEERKVITDTINNDFESSSIIADGDGWGSGTLGDNSLVPRHVTLQLSRSADGLGGTIHQSLDRSSSLRGNGMGAHSAPNVLLFTPTTRAANIVSRPSSASATLRVRAPTSAAQWALVLRNGGAAAGVELLRRGVGAMAPVAAAAAAVGPNVSPRTSSTRHDDEIVASTSSTALIPSTFEVTHARVGIAARLRRGRGSQIAHAELEHAAAALSVATHIREAVAAAASVPSLPSAVDEEEYTSIASASTSAVISQVPLLGFPPARDILLESSIAGTLAGNDAMGSMSAPLSDGTTNFYKLAATWTSAPPPPPRDDDDDDDDVDNNDGHVNAMLLGDGQVSPHSGRIDNGEEEDKESGGGVGGEETYTVTENLRSPGARSYIPRTSESPRALPSRNACVTTALGGDASVTALGGDDQAVGSKSASNGNGNESADSDLAHLSQEVGANVVIVRIHCQ